MIGDVLTSSILFEALRRKYPAAQLHYLIYSHTFPVVENNPFIDKFILYENSSENKGNSIDFLRSIRKEKYNIVIDVYAKLGTAFISAFSGAPLRISAHKWYTSAAYTQTFKPKSELETNAGFAIENRMHLLRGISPDFPVEIKPKIYLTEEEKAAAKRLLLAEDVTEEKPLIMCGILGSSREKTYPLPYMAKILDHIVNRTNAQLLFNYIPKQVEEAGELYDLCASETRKSIFFDIFGKNLREFLALTFHCDALIGNEGGAVNMAKALDVPTFSIFSPQINKADWSIYEDEKNASVHLVDYRPGLFGDLSKKNISERAGEFYETFKPELIFPELERFLKKI